MEWGRHGLVRLDVTDSGPAPTPTGPWAHGLGTGGLGATGALCSLQEGRERQAGGPEAVRAVHCEQGPCGKTTESVLKKPLIGVGKHEGKTYMAKSFGKRFYIHLYGSSPQKKGLYVGGSCFQFKPT